MKLKNQVKRDSKKCRKYLLRYLRNNKIVLIFYKYRILMLAKFIQVLEEIKMNNLQRGLKVEVKRNIVNYSQDLFSVNKNNNKKITKIYF